MVGAVTSDTAAGTAGVYELELPACNDALDDLAWQLDLELWVGSMDTGVSSLAGVYIVGIRGPSEARWV